MVLQLLPVIVALFTLSEISSYNLAENITFPDNFIEYEVTTLKIPRNYSIKREEDIRISIFTDINFQQHYYDLLLDDRIKKREVFIRNTNDGYEYPKPQIPFEIRVNQQYLAPPTTTARDTTRRVITPLATQKTTLKYVPTGYDYPKPKIPFENKVKSQYLLPNTYRTTTTPKSITAIKGYNYSKPVIPSEIRMNPQYFSPLTTTTARPTTRLVTTSSLKTQKTTSKYMPTGYDYPKPNIPFKNKHIPEYLPPITTRRTTTTTKPITTMKGYNYPKPIIPFEIRVNPQYLPPLTTTTARPTTRLVTTSPLKTQKTTSKYTPIGYDYPKPKIPFENKNNPEHLPLITTRRTTTTPKPITTMKGYNYPKPIIPFEIRVNPQYLPPLTTTTARPTTRLVTTSPLKTQETTSKYMPTGYDYPKPKIPFEIKNNPENLPPITTRMPTTTPKPITTMKGYNYPKPIIPFEIRVNPQYLPPLTTTTARPTTRLVTTSPLKTQKNTSKYMPTGYDYPKPKIPFENKNNPEYFPPITTRMTTTTPKPITTIKGYNYPKPVIPFEIRVNQQYLAPPTTTARPITRRIIATLATQKTTLKYVQTGYDYPKPKITFENKVKSQYLLPNTYRTTTTPKSITAIKGYNYPKPVIPFEIRVNPQYLSPLTTTTARPTTRLVTTSPLKTQKTTSKYMPTGYDYPKPKIPFENKNNPEYLPPITTRRTTTTPKPNTTMKGYNYPKPIIPFEIRVNPQYLPPLTTTTARPTTRLVTTSPLKTQKTTSKYTPTGYDYPKPKIPFENKNNPEHLPLITTRMTTTTPKPITTIKGYNYPKPVIPFEIRVNPQYLPPLTTTTARPITRLVTTSPLKTQETTSKYMPTGYDYPTPKIPFENKNIPEYLRPIPITTRRTTTTPKSITAMKGYNYPKPVIPFKIGINPQYL